MSDIPHQQLTDQQIEDVINMLDAANENHKDWLCHLHSCMICGTPVNSDVTKENAHELCKFGRWYYNYAPPLLTRQQEFIDLEQLHKNMHTSARELVIRIARREGVCKTDYQAFVAIQHAFSDTMKALRDRMYERLYSYDMLTGLMTRGPFLSILDAECAREARTGEPCCIVLIDIDFFKEINDEYGHLVGDRVLVFVARFMRKRMRLYDSICRYGGEEFLIALPGTDLDQAYSIMERLRKELEQLDIEFETDKFIKITSSFGIARLTHQQGYDSCLKKADQALYQAKLSGRNRVCVAPS